MLITAYQLLLVHLCFVQFYPPQNQYTHSNASIWYWLEEQLPFWISNR